MHKLTIILPPLMLLLIGAAAYIMVVKMTTPQPIVISGSPQASTSATQQSSYSASEQPTIITHVTVPTEQQIKDWQSDASNGSAAWRLDPLSAAKEIGLDYGFTSSDQFSAQQTAGEQVSIVTADHEGKSYLLTMYQPGVIGLKGIWIIKSIALK